MRALLAVAALACFAPPVRAQGVTLVHKTPPGQELTIDESTLLDADVEITHPDFAGGKSKTRTRLIEHKVRAYHQLLVAAPAGGPRRLELLFQTATKETMRPGGKDRVKAPTSLHGKRVLVDIDGHTLGRVQPSAGTVADDDKNDLLFAEKLYSTLPEGEVKAGKTWAINPDVAGRALFGAGYDPALHSVEGRCKYTGTTSADGRKCAKVLVQLKASGRFADVFSLEMAPEGTLLFALEEGFIQAYDLAGPVQLSAADKAGGFTVTGGGRMTLKYRAKVADGGADAEPGKPPAGTSK